jgi:hypothetical protein
MMSRQQQLGVLAIFLGLFAHSIASESAKAGLAILHQPSYQTYDYSGSSGLKLSDFKNLVLAASGFSIQQVIHF